MTVELIYRPIGVVHSPFSSPEGMPIQPTGRATGPGTVGVFAQFADGLSDIDGFSHLIMVVHLHKAAGVDLKPAPFLDADRHGIFATRAPVRPNPIGVSVVRLDAVNGSVLHIANLDLLDGTPVLDIKSCVPAFDAHEDCRIGWMESSIDRFGKLESDDRFV